MEKELNEELVRIENEVKKLPEGVQRMFNIALSYILHLW